METVLTAEPGGTAISRKIRELLLSTDNTEMAPLTELLLYAAARRQHVEEVIFPALRDGKTVITDRFSDSTRAYQGAARGLGYELIDELDRIVTGGLKPDITLLLDIDPGVGLLRNRRSGKEDRIELEDIDFHNRVREGFFSIKKAEPNRVKLLQSGGSIEEVQSAIVDILRKAKSPDTGLSLIEVEF
jgi:dTMP kinase